MTDRNTDGNMALWDTLHAQPRFRPRYPNEHVVRFLMRNFSNKERNKIHALDIGVGGGRHTKLLCDLSFQTSGIDISSEGLKHCQAWLASDGQSALLKQASMLSLPFQNDTFNLVIAFGVLYYTNVTNMQLAVNEIHRILSKGGLAFVVVRTNDDYRYGKGACLEPNTFLIEIEDTNEYGTVQHFLTKEELNNMFGIFSEIKLEKAETSFNNLQFFDSDWLIQVRK